MSTSSPAGLTNAIYMAPAGAVVIPAGANIQAAVNAHPAGTSFLLSVGTYTGQTISPSNGDSFYGVPGQTILDGSGVQQAFRGQGMSNVTVANITFTKYAPLNNTIGVLGTDGSSNNWIVEGDTFTGITNGTPICLGNNWIVRNNTIDGNENAGLGGYQISGSVVEDNDIYNNNLAAQSPYTATSGNAGIKIFEDSDVQIINNIIYENQLAPGVWTDGGCSGTVVTGNVITNNGAPGIVDEIDYGETISNNIITDNDMALIGGIGNGGIYIYNAQNATISGNTLSGNGGGVYVYTSTRGSGTQGTYVVNNDKITGNTIQLSLGQNGFTSGISNANVQFSDNAYDLSGSAELISGGTIKTPAQWQSSGQDAASTGSTFSDASSIPVSVVTPDPPVTAPTDTLTLQISEDAWEGDAQFTVSVDGKQVGGDYTASALHSSGDAGTFLLTGDWGASVNDVQVSFINDAYGGTAAADRNLYVNSIGYNGVIYAGTTATLWSNGSDTFAVGGTTPTAAASADNLTLNLSEDAWKGNADFVLYLDGKVVTTPQVVSALHNANTTQGFSFTGDLGAGTHTIGVGFVNDAYGGSVSEDRNLYVNGITLNGSDVFSGLKAQDSNGISNFTLTTTH